MKSAVLWWAIGLIIPILVLPMALGALFAAIGGRAHIAQSANELYTTPAELTPLLREVGEATGHSYPWLAAWLWVYYPEYKLPGVPTRPEIEAEMSDETCWKDEDGKEHCRVTRPSHATVEAEWRVRAKAWLDKRVRAISSEAREEERLPYEKRVEMDAVRDSVQAYQDSLITPEEQAAWAELTVSEDYQVQLSLREWPYRFPVNHSAHFVDDWHEERGQNAAFGAVEWHQGTDIMAPEGTPVVAVCKCRVKKSGWNKLGGWTIELEDPLYHIIFYYAHLQDDPQLAPGTEIDEGVPVARVGHTGEGEEGALGAWDPHLHFGIYTDRGATNPYPYLRRWQGGPGGVNQNP